MPEPATPDRTVGPPAAGPDRGRARVPARVVAFVAGLAVMLATGYGIGRATGAGGGTGPAAVQAGAADGHGHAHGPATGPAAGPAVASGTGVGGLSVSDSGYTVVPESTSFAPRTQRPFRFRVHGPDGAPITRFAVVHDKPMHLIVVRRDLTGYQHLHPGMAPDGTWSVPLALPAPGTWRAYLDFTATDPAGFGTPLVLGVDLTVAGDYRPRALAAAGREATVDGLTVTYDGTPRTGATQPVLLRVFQDGTPVTGQLRRYLGAYGHLVVLREGDLGYLHVHPEDQLADSAVKFWVAAPSPGRYRMYFDFQLGDPVRTAQFTVTVP